MPQDTARPSLDKQAIHKAYRAWAPVYDYSFGVVAAAGRNRAVKILNGGQGRILEIGVGTGLSLPRYGSKLEVVGIDLSAEMLEKAHSRVKKLTLKRTFLAIMDAGRLGFASASFDAAAVMYVMTVVPDPASVLAEMRRVLRPGGTAIVVNHFSRESGLRATAERALSRFSRQLGWHPIFPLEVVTDSPGFRLIEKIELPPAGLFTLLHLRKTD